MPQVRDIIDALKEFNQDANINVVSEEGRRLPFAIAWSGDEGCEKYEADTVSFYIIAPADKMSDNPHPEDTQALIEGEA